MIGISGTHSLLDFSLSNIFKAIPDWFEITFGPNVYYKLSNGEATYVNWFIYRRALFYYNMLTKYGHNNREF